MTTNYLQSRNARSAVSIETPFAVDVTISNLVILKKRQLRILSMELVVTNIGQTYITDDTKAFTITLEYMAYNKNGVQLKFSSISSVFEIKGLPGPGGAAVSLKASSSVAVSTAIDASLKTTMSIVFSLTNGIAFAAGDMFIMRALATYSTLNPTAASPDTDTGDGTAGSIVTVLADAAGTDPDTELAYLTLIPASVAIA